MESLGKQAGGAFSHSTSQLICTAFYPQNSTRIMRARLSDLSFQIAHGFMLPVIACGNNTLPNHMQRCLRQHHPELLLIVESASVNKLSKSYQPGLARDNKQTPPQCRYPHLSNAADAYYEKRPRSATTEPERQSTRGTP